MKCDFFLNFNHECKVPAERYFINGATRRPIARCEAHVTLKLAHRHIAREIEEAYLVAMDEYSIRQIMES
jgi:hypothetical protein